MKYFKHELKTEYPLSGTTEELVERMKELISQAEEYKLEESNPDELESKLAEEKKKATAWLAFKLSVRVKKQDPILFKSPEIQALRKRASKLCDRTLLIGIIIIYVALLLGVFLLLLIGW